MGIEIPDDVWGTYAAVAQKYPPKNPNGDTTDDYRREQHKKAVQTVRARHGFRWNSKSEHSNLHPATDALVLVPEGLVEHGKRMEMYIWDMVNGTTLEVTPPHESEDIREAYVLVFPPYDWLKDVEPEPGPDPVPIPTPTSKVEELLNGIIANQQIQHELLHNLNVTMQEQTVQIKNAVGELKAEVAKGVLIRFR